MPEDTQPASRDIKKSPDTNESTSLHTCVCGETHEQHEEGISHRDECESSLKFGKTCCCGSEKASHGESHRCGHGPRCR